MRDHRPTVALIVRGVFAGSMLALTCAASAASATVTEQALAADTATPYEALNRDALARYEAGHFEAAARVLRAALAMAHHAVGTEHADSLALENNLAAMLQAEGHYREAEPHFQHVLDVRMRTLEPDDPETLLARNNLAEALQGEGRYRHAEVLLRSNHAAYVRRLGATAPDSLRALNNLAAVLALRGQYEEAERMHRRVLAAQRASLAAGDPALLASMENLAAVLDEQGRHEDAEALLRQVVDARVAIQAPAHPLVLSARANLAASLVAQARTTEADALLHTSIADARHMLGPTHPLTLAAMATLANSLARQGRAGDAEALQRSVLAARRASLGNNHPDTLATMAQLAAILRGPGRTDEAAQLLAAAIAGSDTVLGPTHPAGLRLRSQQVRLLLSAARHQESLHALRALEPLLRSREEYEAARARGTDRLRAIGREDAGFVDLVLTLAMQAPALAARYAADLIARTKYVGAESDAIVEHAARNERDPSVLTVVQRVRRGRAFVARAAHGVGADGADALHRALLQLEADEAALARHSHAFRTAREHAASADAARISAALPAGALLLDLRLYRDMLQPDGPLAERYAVSVIAADGRVAVRDLGPVAATRDAVRDAADINRLIDDDARTGARGLYAALFGELDPLLAVAERVYLVPDGPLHAVPFHALVLGDGRYWVERQRLHVLGSARDLLQAARTHEGDALLAIGGVDYGTSAARTETAETYVQLPGSRREAEALDRRWRELGLPTRVWTDARASEVALKALDAAPDYLHLATHGFFMEGAESAHLPLVASGIALAGANRAPGAHDAAEDGILYAEEALDLALEGTELVVLSACETARGVDAHWEGSLGLVRALRTAGARNVLSSLWQIGDEYAAPFMTSFYERLLQDPQRDAAAALRATQLDWIRSDEPARRYPENWAAFVLVLRQ